MKNHAANSYVISGHGFCILESIDNLLKYGQIVKINYLDKTYLKIIKLGNKRRLFPAAVFTQFPVFLVVLL